MTNDLFRNRHFVAGLVLACLACVFALAAGTKIFAAARPVPELKQLPLPLECGEVRPCKKSGQNLVISANSFGELQAALNLFPETRVVGLRLGGSIFVATIQPNL